MKARWLLITLLLAFPFAFAFFLSEARLREKRPTKPALVVAPLPPPAPAATDLSQSAPPIENQVPLAEPQPSKTENPAPSATTTDLAQSSPPIENRDSKIENPPAVLFEGTFTKESNALVYETDAKLQLPNNVFLSSPTGVMVSDEQQKIFAGDMQLLNKQQTISANEAVLTLQPGGSSVLTSKTLSITSNDNTQPALEIKGDNLTLTIPAKKTPAVATPEIPEPSSAPSTTPTP